MQAHLLAYRSNQKFTDGQNSPDVRSAVNRYQLALLMPWWLLRDVDPCHELCKWAHLYRLTDEALVNTSNSSERFQRLDLIHLPAGHAWSQKQI
jgi:hypothetical protein